MAILLVFLVPAAYSQNTKGDRPIIKGGAKRESRFRLLPSKKSKPKKSYNRIQGRRFSLANRAGSSKPAKIYSQKGPFVNNTSRTAKVSRQNLRSSPSRVNARSITTQTRNVYPQRGQYINNRSRTEKDSKQQARKNSAAPRVSVRSATGRVSNVYKQRGMFVNNPSRKPQSVERAVSNRPQLARLKRLTSQPESPKRKKRVTPASVSRSYIARRSINAFAGFWNRKPRGEKAFIGDIAGRKLRTKNFETKRPFIINPTANPYRPKKNIGAKLFRNNGGYFSATQPPKAWLGDIAGRKLRGKNYTSKKSIEGKPVFPRKKLKPRVGDTPYKGSIPGGGNKSVSGKIKKGNYPLPVKTPGIGADKIGSYQGNIKGGKIFSPQGGNYSGNIKSRKPLKGGGSVSGKQWNNNGYPNPVRTPGAGADRVGTFQGNMKAQRPVKGGGSVSGKRWNNKGFPIAVRIPGAGADRAGTFQGNIKTQRPLKGGGSISGRLWNNKQLPIAKRIPPAGAEKVSGYPGGYKLFDLKPSMRNQGEEFTGYKKARKPIKGGGSISGKLWNNSEQPIPGKAPKGVGFDTFQGNIKVNKKEPSKEVGGFPGKHHAFDFHPSMRNQGEEFTGAIRLPRFKKQYIKNPNAADEAMKKSRPEKPTYLTNGLPIKVKQQEYKKRPNAAEGSMSGIAPGKNSILASEYKKAMRLTWAYKHNPSSADAALNVREPGKAFARAGDYQGNIKMKKFDLFGNKNLHPDSKFVKTNKNNTDEERTAVTNFKLWWARLFKKNDTQPDHLKEKYRKPRYDKREDGLWAD